LTANRCCLSGDIASGRTCPLSNTVNRGPAAGTAGGGMASWLIPTLVPGDCSERPVSEGRAQDIAMESDRVVMTMTSLVELQGECRGSIVPPFFSVAVRPHRHDSTTQPDCECRTSW